MQEIAVPKGFSEVGFSLVRFLCGVHTEFGRYLGSTLSGVTDLGFDLELAYNEAVPFITGSHSIQNPRWTQKPIYSPGFNTLY